MMNLLIFLVTIRSLNMLPLLLFHNLIVICFDIDCVTYFLEMLSVVLALWLLLSVGLISLHAQSDVVQCVLMLNAWLEWALILLLFIRYCQEITRADVLLGICCLYVEIVMVAFLFVVVVALSEGCRTKYLFWVLSSILESICQLIYLHGLVRVYFRIIYSVTKVQSEITVFWVVHKTTKVFLSKITQCNFVLDWSKSQLRLVKLLQLV